MRILVPLAYNDAEASQKLDRVRTQAEAWGWFREDPSLTVIDTGAAYAEVQHRFGKDLGAWAEYAGAGMVADGPAFHAIVLVDAELSSYTGRIVQAALRVGRPVVDVHTGARVKAVQEIPGSGGGRRMARWSWA